MIPYFLWANIYAALLFALYSFFIKGRPNHAWSRFYLLSTVLLSMVLPLIKLDALSPLVARNIQVINLPEIFLNTTAKPLVESGHGYDFWKMGYLIIASLLILQFVYRLITLKIFLNKQLLIQKEGYRLGVNTGYGPASFSDVILFPGNEIDPLILRHEMAHLVLKHHYDKMLFQLLRCFFFPILVFHLVYKELMIVHEFEADEQAGIDKEAYSKTLLAAHIGSHQLYLLQNFFHHPLKRRIMMLYKNKRSNKGRKALLLTFSVITLGAVMILQSKPLIAQEKKEAVVKDEVYSSVDQVPEFPGGLDSLMQYLSRNIHYPEAAQKKNIEGRVEVQFIVDKKGNVKDAIILKDVPMGCGEEAKRVVLSMPKWKPGMQNGKKVSVYYTLPISFRLAK
jgi:TonB family protein